MIRVTHGDAPPELERERRRRVAELRLDWGSVDAADPHGVEAFVEQHGRRFDAGYRAQAWDTLRAQWSHRCAYCTAELHESDPIDHHRPRRPRPGEHRGYWWLTWTWRNLLPSCTTCNGAKDTNFPVEGPRLAPFDGRTGTENAVLIDPSRDNPLDHLEFASEVVDGGGERWTLQGKKGSPRGKETARILRLDVDRDEARFGAHLDRLRHLVADLRRELAKGPVALHAFWERKIGLFLGRTRGEPAQPYPALSHAYLRHHFGSEMEMHCLTLPELGDSPPSPAPRSGGLKTSAWAGLDENLQLELQSLSKRPPRDKTRDLILRFVAVRPRTLDQLAEVFPQSIATLRTHVRALVDAGKLRYDGAAVKIVRP